MKQIMKLEMDSVSSNESFARVVVARESVVSFFIS